MASNKEQRRADRAARKKARRDSKAHKRDQRHERQASRQEARGTRKSTRQEGRTSRTDLRTEARREKVKQKGESGYWSPEGIEARQPWEDFAELGGNIAAAFGGGSGDPELGGMDVPDYGGGYDSNGDGYSGSDSDSGDDYSVPLTDRVWFYPAVGAGAVGLYLATRPKKRKRK